MDICKNKIDFVDGGKTRTEQVVAIRYKLSYNICYTTTLMF